MPHFGVSPKESVPYGLWGFLFGFLGFFFHYELVTIWVCLLEAFVESKTLVVLHASRNKPQANIRFSKKLDHIGYVCTCSDLKSGHQTPLGFPPPNTLGGGSGQLSGFTRRFCFRNRAPGMLLGHHLGLKFRTYPAKTQQNNTGDICQFNQKRGTKKYSGRRRKKKNKMPSPERGIPAS